MAKAKKAKANTGHKPRLTEVDFTLPFKDCYISILVENKDGKLKNNGYCHWIYGQVLNVTHGVYDCVITARYIDPRDYPKVILKRTDTFKYAEYGCKTPKNWHVLTKEGAEHRHLTQGHGTFAKTIPRLPIDNTTQVITNKTIETSLEVPEELPCQACGKQNANHPRYGIMLICSQCNFGYHQHCLETPLITIPEGDWICQDCQAFC